MILRCAAVVFAVCVFTICRFSVLAEFQVQQPAAKSLLIDEYDGILQNNKLCGCGIDPIVLVGHKNFSSNADLIHIQIQEPVTRFENKGQNRIYVYSNWDHKSSKFNTSTINKHAHSIFNLPIIPHPSSLSIILSAIVYLNFLYRTKK